LLAPVAVAVGVAATTCADAVDGRAGDLGGRDCGGLPRMMLGFALGAGITALVLVKLVARALVKAGQIVAGWFYRSL
jgi:Na+-transporting NADH:ubiquinone oxidoreductase subunit NqrD